MLRLFTHLLRFPTETILRWQSQIQQKHLATQKFLSFMTLSKGIRSISIGVLWTLDVLTITPSVKYWFITIQYAKVFWNFFRNLRNLQNLKLKFLCKKIKFENSVSISVLISLEDDFKMFQSTHFLQNPWHVLQCLWWCFHQEPHVLN